MLKRDDLTQSIYSLFGKDLLAKAALVDTMPNGVQIKGKLEVEKIALGVSASPDFINQAILKHADYLIVHHGLHTDSIINGRFEVYEHRLRSIFNHNLTLAGFHYALDAHPDVGNNAQIISLLGAHKTGETYFDGWGYIGEFNHAVPLERFTQKAEALFNHKVITVNAGLPDVKRFGVCSGGAVPRAEWYEAIDKQIDTHLTGEIKESVPGIAKELQLNYVACGHYATETFGIKALGEKLKTQYGGQVEIEFIDIPTDL